MCCFLSGGWVEDFTSYAGVQTGEAVASHLFYIEGQTRKRPEDPGCRSREGPPCLWRQGFPISQAHESITSVGVEVYTDTGDTNGPKGLTVVGFTDSYCKHLCISFWGWFYQMQGEGQWVEFSGRRDWSIMKFIAVPHFETC